MNERWPPAWTGWPAEVCEPPPPWLVREMLEKMKAAVTLSNVFNRYDGQAFAVGDRFEVRIGDRWGK